MSTRGRPRDAGADEAILAATIELLNDGGIANLSMDHVAKRAGVGNATIYRRWPSKEQLVIEALSTVPKIVIDVLLGAFFYRRMVSGEPFTVRFATRLVDFALRSARLPA
jgi:AcrR family transcriptional regulator